jgi:predicted Zn finger-like uncharacterized protein
MATVVTCPHCEGQCAVEEQHLGMALKCPRCGDQFNAEAPAQGGGGGGVRSRRPAPKFERGSVTERAAGRAKETPMEKYFVVGILVVVVGLILGLIMFGGSSAAVNQKIGTRKSLADQAETDPAMREKLKREEERRRYYEQQEQTPGAKAAYERQMEKEKK